MKKQKIRENLIHKPKNIANNKKFVGLAGGLIIAVVAIAGIVIILVSNAAPVDVLQQKNVESVHSNTNSQIFTPGSNPKIVNVQRNIFKNDGRSGTITAPMVELTNNQPAINQASFPSGSVTSYTLKLPKKDGLILCQTGIVKQTNSEIWLNIRGDGIDLGSRIGPNPQVSTQPNLTKSLQLAKTVSNSNADTPAPKILACTDIFKITKDNATLEYRVGVATSPGTSTQASPAVIGNPASVLLGNFVLFRPSEQSFTDIEKTEAQKVNDKCIDGTPGDKVIGGKVTDGLDRPVPVLIGIDYEPKEGLPAEIEEKIDSKPNTLYDDFRSVNVYTDTSGLYPRDQKRWCVRVPAGVKKVYLEIYSREVKDSTKKYVVNNAWDFGGYTKHGVEVDIGGKGSIDLKANDDNYIYTGDILSNGKPTGNYTTSAFDIVLPTSCSAIPSSEIGNVNSKYKAGNIIVKTKINGTTMGEYPMKELKRKRDSNGNVLKDTLGNDVFETVYVNAIQPARNIAWSGPDNNGEWLSGYGGAEYKDARYGNATTLHNLAPQEPGYRLKSETNTNRNRYHTWVSGVLVEPCYDTEVTINITDPSPTTIGDVLTRSTQPTACSVEITIPKSDNPERRRILRKNCDSNAVGGYYGGVNSYRKLPNTPGAIKVRLDDLKPETKDDLNTNWDYF